MKQKIQNFVCIIFLLTVISCSAQAQSSLFADAPTGKQVDVIPDEAITDLLSLQNSFRSVSQAVLPSIVRIDVRQLVAVENNQGRGFPGFEFFFDKQEDEPKEYYSQGLGSGVIVRRDGQTYYVLTNHHVVQESEDIVITLNDDRQYDAAFIGSDPRKDIALVSFETDEDDVFLARLGNSDNTLVGDWVLAMGSPFGFQSTVTAGIVSALGRQGPQENINDFIQTDAAINRGNSGGALVNIRGEVIGINTWISTQTGVNIGLGFAIPINNVLRTMDQLINGGEVRYGWLGVGIEQLDREWVSDLGLPDNNGVLVRNLFLGSPADKGGLLPGDVIVAIRGKKIQGVNELVRTVGDLPIDKISKFTFYRNGQEQESDVRITRRQADEQIAVSNNRQWPGIFVQPITDEMRQEYDIDKRTNGLLITQVIEQSKMAAGGVKIGDILIQLDDAKIEGLSDFYRKINTKASKIKLKILRDGDLRLTLEIDKP